MSSKISEGERTPTISSVTKKSQPKGAPRTHLESAPLVVAIDGPAASGKSSVARALAAAHGLTYINSGAMYRAVTWSALQAGIDPTDEAAVIAHLDASPIDYTTVDGVAHFTIGGRDVGDELKSAEVNDQVSTIASHGSVRERLVAQQREIGKNGRIVMEGRDIGSVVFPDTPHKFYIDASEEVRRRRRQSEGFNDDLSKRDKADSSRQNSPLVVDPGATTIDSSELTIDQVVEAIAGHLGDVLG
jgi:cytidylate kinase